MPAKPLHTLDARDNVMLEVIQQYFKLTPERMFCEIQGLRQAAEDALTRKGISYDALKFDYVVFCQVKTSLGFDC